MNHEWKKEDEYHTKCIKCRLDKYNLNEYFKDCDSVEKHYEDKEKLEKIDLNDYSEEGAMFSKNSNGMVTVVAFNEGGYNATSVELKGLLEKTKKHFPKLWSSIE